MNPEKSPLMSRLILVVLSLILGCLVLLVLRAYEKAPSAEPSALAAVEEGEAVLPVSLPEDTAPAQRPLPRRPPPTSPPRVALATPSPSADSPGEPGAGMPAVAPVVVPVIAGAGGFPRNPGNAHGSAGRAGAGASTGEIIGVVSLVGTPPPPVPIDMGPNCGRLQRDIVTTRHYVVSPEGGLANILVYVSKGGSSQTAAIPLTVILDQQGCMFEPFVLAMQKDQKLLVRNLDPEMHNVHLLPRINQEHNRAQPAGAPPLVFTFPKSEMFMRLKCDVHPWMFAYVNVLNHPFFAVTDTNGQFRLPAVLAAGRYTVTAAHHKMGALVQEVTLKQGETRSLEFQFINPGIVTPQGQVYTSE